MTTSNIAVLFLGYMNNLYMRSLQMLKSDIHFVIFYCISQTLVINGWFVPTTDNTGPTANIVS